MTSHTTDMRHKIKSRGGRADLTLDASKTKELVIDFSREKASHPPITINSTEFEMLGGFKFLGDTKYQYYC